MSRIFITGDTHGSFNRFSNVNWPLAKTLNRDDVVIITGDFGGVWDNSDSETYWLNWLEDRPFTTLFVDGNHENYDLLNTYPQEHWHGGEVDVIRPHVRHLKRGYIYTINNCKFFVMGGASSHDIADGILDPNSPNFEDDYWRMNMENKQFRIKGVSWWPQELPCKEEYDRAIKNLDANNWTVDVVLTHCAPTSLLQYNEYEYDALTDFLQMIKRKINCKGWYFGHYHQNVDLEEKYHCQYRNITELKI